MTMTHIRDAALRESNPQATLQRIRRYTSTDFLDTQTIPGNPFHVLAIHQMKKGIVEGKPQIPSCALGNRALSRTRDSFDENKLVIVHVAEPAKSRDPKPSATILKQTLHLKPQSTIVYRAHAINN